MADPSLRGLRQLMAAVYQEWVQSWVLTCLNKTIQRCHEMSHCRNGQRSITRLSLHQVAGPGHVPAAARLFQLQMLQMLQMLQVSMQWAQWGPWAPRDSPSCAPPRWPCSGASRGAAAKWQSTLLLQWHQSLSTVSNGESPLSMGKSSETNLLWMVDLTWFDNPRLCNGIESTNKGRVIHSQLIQNVVGNESKRNGCDIKSSIKAHGWNWLWGSQEHWTWRPKFSYKSKKNIA